MVSELTWVSILLRDLRIPQPSPALLHCDNLSAVYLSANPALHSRSKHFETDYHYIREQVALGLIETKHIPAHSQLADIFTKPLPRIPFIQLRHKLGVAESPTSSLRGNVSDSQDNKLGQEQNISHEAHKDLSLVCIQQNKPILSLQNRTNTETCKTCRTSVPVQNGQKKKSLISTNRFEPLGSLNE